MFVNKHISHTLGAYISKNKRCNSGKPLAYYFVKAKITVDFHIFNTVPLPRYFLHRNLTMALLASPFFARLSVYYIFVCNILAK